MQARALKWGNSLAVRLPKALAAQLQVRENDPLELTVREGVLQLRPIKREWTLDELLEGISAENRHDLALPEDARGAEAW